MRGIDVRCRFDSPGNWASRGRGRTVSSALCENNLNLQGRAAGAYTYRPVLLPPPRCVPQSPRSRRCRDVVVMRDPRSSKALLYALAANAAALALIAIVLFSRSGSSLPDLLPSAMAQNQLPIGGGAGVFIVPGQFTTTSYGCYIMDVDAQTLCAYQYMPSEKTMRLVAARTFRHDRRLGNYNTAPPPMEIKEMVDKEQADVRAKDPQK